jgi:HlyD family secretion protein
MPSDTVTVQSITRRRKRSRWTGWVIWTVILAGLAGGGYWYWQGQASATETVRYTTKPVGKGDITVIVTAVGTVQPIQQVEVSSLIAGTIAEVTVEINDVVTKGQVLARLDTSSLEAELARDQASLSARRAEVEDAIATQDAALAALTRAEKLRVRGLNSEEDLAAAATAKRRADATLASARANVHVAEANVKLSQTSIDKADIVAPIDGMVLDMTADLGQTVSAGGATTALFTLAHDLGQMQLQIDVDEADIGKVELGDMATFTVDAYLGQTFPASVSSLRFAPQEVDGVVTYATILDIDNSDHRLRPGMTASADVTVEQTVGVLAVPNAAFRYTPPVAQAGRQQSSGLLGMLFSGGPPGGGNRQRTSITNEVDRDGFRNLYVLKDGVATKISVKTGLTDGDLTEIVEGPLAEGDEVVTGQSVRSQ